MEMTKREELLTRMIRLYSFEHEEVIHFARMMEDEKMSDETLEIIVECHEQYPVHEPWEDDEEDF